ncbi:MAG TPA: hypothetical protein VFT12_00015 [Thermoanaerobaculia bacterium]|nr:hypothetical protein [Thermoanaerobaculia bacterium]
MRFLFQIAVTALAISIAQFVAGAVAITIFSPEAFPPFVQGTMPWQLAANTIAAVVLAWLASRARFTGGRLAATLALIYFGIMHFNSLIEAWFFGFVTPRQFGALISMTLFMAVLLAAMLTPLLSGQRQAGMRTWSPRLTGIRLAAGSVSYLVIYFVAGISIYPFISHFYDLQTTPPGLQVIAMQLLVRGPIFVALAAIVVLMSKAGRLETILMTGTALAVIGGVAPLLVPNALMPDSIRWYHFIEVTTSNFVFGLILGWLFIPGGSRIQDATEEPYPAGRVEHRPA